MRLGAVLQIRIADATAVNECLRSMESHNSKRPRHRPTTAIVCASRSTGKVALDELRHNLHRAWSETSFRLQALRDNPECRARAF